MTSLVRFGRRIKLSSTVQILLDLRAFSASEDARRKIALSDGLPEAATWEDIGLYRAKLKRSALREPSLFSRWLSLTQ